MSTTIKIHFLGAAKTVTGSKFLLETPEGNLMIDCGVFQGLKELRERNWAPFPFPADTIDRVLLTHGHLDHCGYLPRLRKQGFKAPITGTAPSLAIASIILQDSAKIHEEEAKRANEEGYSSHHPALPFYKLEDAEAAIALFVPQQAETWHNFSENIQYRFIQNGHILGATFIELDVFGKRFVFSGDIGRNDDILLESPKRPKWADYLFLESTYGNKLHPEQDVEQLLIESVHEALHNQGTIIIPSFAVERLQTLMFLLWTLYTKNKIPNIPVFIDSPMGNEVLSVFERFDKWHKLSRKEFSTMQRHFNIITSYKDTWKTIDEKRPKIVIAGSGMVTGGRVLTYLRYYLDQPQTQVILSGYQAEGTRGRQLLDGAHELKIQGKYIPVKAKVKLIESLSAHADQADLLQWVADIKNVPEHVFLIHGEPSAQETLRVKLKDTYQWLVTIPELNQITEIQL